MSAAEFLAIYGPPSDDRHVTEVQIEQAYGRVPDSLINFWREYGIGSYAKGNYWLCTADLFDPYLDRILKNIPHLQGKLAAFGYYSTGQVDLWHVDDRLWSLLLPFAHLDDQTSRRETAPVPYDLKELYELAGVPMPPNAAEELLRQRDRPEDLWLILLGSASLKEQEFQLDDDGLSLTESLRRRYGRLSPEEIYRRRPNVIPELPGSFDRIRLHEVFAEILPIVTVSHMVELNGQQELITETFPTS